MKLTGLSLVMTTFVVACTNTPPKGNGHVVVEKVDGAVPEGTDAATGEDGCDALTLEPPAPGHGVQIYTDMVLAPGEERQTCKLLMTGEDIRYNWGDGVFTNGSHHATVWRTSHTGSIPTVDVTGKTLDTSGPVDCLSAGDWNGSGVIAAGHKVDADAADIADYKGALPDDVAFKIGADEVLLMNFHMVNLTDKPVHACYKQNLPSVPADQVKQEAGMMFFYNPFITVPASSSATAEMACPVASDINVATAVSHMHRRGMGYKATLVDGDPSAGGKDVMELYSGKDWDEPRANVWKPALNLKAGQWIRFACQYENGEQRDVAQGQQTTDEMCMFVGLYWPRNAAWDRCGFDGAGKIFGTGTKDGAAFVDCWNKSTKNLGLYGGGAGDSATRYAAQRCVTDSCPAVSALASDYIFGGKQDVATATCN